MQVRFSVSSMEANIVNKRLVDVWQQSVKLVMAAEEASRQLTGVSGPFWA